MTNDDYKFQLDIDTLSHLDYLYFKEKKKEQIARIILECAETIDDIRKKQKQSFVFDEAIKAIE